MNIIASSVKITARETPNYMCISEFSETRVLLCGHCIRRIKSKQRHTGIGCWVQKTRKSYYYFNVVYTFWLINTIIVYTILKWNVLQQIKCRTTHVNDPFPVLNNTSFIFQLTTSESDTDIHELHSLDGSLLDVCHHIWCVYHS